MKEAKTLGDITLIYNDLASTVDILKRLRELLKTKCKDQVILESLWTTALIKYYRCFKHGKRKFISSDIFKDKKLEGDPLGCHNYYYNMRSKHIAHSVNPFEQVKINGVLSDDKKKVIGIALLSQKLVCIDLDGTETFLKLVMIAKNHVCEKVKEYRNRVVEKCKTLPIEALPKELSVKLKTPSPDEVCKDRV